MSIFKFQQPFEYLKHQLNNFWGRDSNVTIIAIFIVVPYAFCSENISKNYLLRIKCHLFYMYVLATYSNFLE